MTPKAQMSTSEKSGNLIVRGVDGKLAREVKSVAAAEGMTMRAWILEAIQDKLARWPTGRTFRQKSLARPG